MGSINKELNMNTIEIPYYNIKREFPSSIQELTSKQFLYLTVLFIKLMSDRISIEDFKVLLVCHLLKIKKGAKWYRLKADDKNIVMDNLSRLSVLADGFLQYDASDEDNQVRVTISTNFTRNLIPRIKNYYGPEDVLQNCTAFEYKCALTAYKLYNDTQKEEYLDELVAVLYRKKRNFLWIKKYFYHYKSDVRRPMKHDTNPLFLEKRAKKLSKVRFEIKYGVYIIFQAFVNYMCSETITIDGYKIDLASLHKDTDSADDDGIGMIGLFYELAESKVFGSLVDVMNTNIYDILVRLYQLVKMSEKLRKPTDDKN